MRRGTVFEKPPIRRHQVLGVPAVTVAALTYWVLQRRAKAHESRLKPEEWAEAEEEDSAPQKEAPKALINVLESRMETMDTIYVCSEDSA